MKVESFSVAVLVPESTPTTVPTAPSTGVATLDLDFFLGSNEESEKLLILGDETVVVAASVVDEGGTAAVVVVAGVGAGTRKAEGGAIGMFEKDKNDDPDPEDEEDAGVEVEAVEP